MQRPTSRFLAHVVILTLVGSLFSLISPAFQPSYASHENITVNVSGDEVTDTYGENDEIGIDGIIEDVIDNEDVIIRVGEPGDSTPDQVQADEPSSNGNFDYLYEVPSGPEDGVYSVEVEYDDEFAYTYFIVDDEDDTITVELDKSDHIYEAGDDVTISGQVENEDISQEDSVMITVFDPLDPYDNPIIDEEQVELDDDEFEFSFDLENDASHGRYAVMVTYDVDNQDGSTLFEILDENDDGGSAGGFTGDDDSDGDLSAQIEQDSYEPGETVAIEGTVDGYDSGDNEDLEIVVQDPDDEEVDDYSDDNADVDSDGDFDYDFDLADDSDEGTYTVIISYAGDEVQLTFEVEEGSTSGGGSSDLSVRLNKASYLAGETMTVTGTVEDVADPDEGEQVSVFIYRPTGQVILGAGSSKYITPSSDGKYSTTIVIPSDLNKDEDYKVIVSYLGESVESTFDITGVSSTPSDGITVETDSDEYSIGQTVEISGDVPDALILDGQQLLIRINKPDGNPCRIDPINVPAGGAYSYELVLGGVCGVAGEYEVQVTYGQQEADTTFKLIGSSASSYNLNAGGKTYLIDYEMTAGTINSIFPRPDENKLVINIDAEEDGQLTLKLPREVIDAIENEEDIAYVVTIEDSSGQVTALDVEESEKTDKARTLVIDYETGAERIEIIGTRVVPEFGAIAAIVMAVAIVGIIAATTKYNKFNLFRQ